MTNSMKEIIETHESNDRFMYMMLSRFQMDCDFYLGHGNRNEKILWSLNVSDHIQNMKDLYNNFKEDEKPEWLTMEQIEEYERLMTA